MVIKFKWEDYYWFYSSGSGSMRAIQYAWFDGIHEQLPAIEKLLLEIMEVKDGN